MENMREKLDKLLNISFSITGDYHINVGYSQHVNWIDVDIFRMLEGEAVEYRSYIINTDEEYNEVLSICEKYKDKIVTNNIYCD